MTASGRYIPAQQRMAAFASMLLPEAERNELRKRKACAGEVLERFEMHHVIYHAWTKENRWWNLDPQLKADHKRRTKIDIAIIGKAKRIQRKQAKHKAKLNEESLIGIFQNMPEPARSFAVTSAVKSWRKARKIPSRPFAKAKRKLRKK